MDSSGSETDPLMELVVDDARSVDRSRLAKLLKLYVGFDRETKQFQLLPDFELLSSNELKVELILLASKARSLLFDLQEGLSPIEIIKLGAMPEGSVKSSIKKLNDDRKIKKDTAGKYSVPNYRLGRVIERVEVEKEGK